MTIIRRDVKIVYDDPPAGVIATPPGSGLITLGSSSPILSIPAATLYPNEPPGYTRFAEYAFNTVPIGLGSAPTGDEIDGCIWKWPVTNGNYSIVQDPTAPGSPPNVLGIRYPVGQPSGSGPGFYQLWDNCGEASNVEYSKVYLSLRIKLAGGPNGDLTDWENHHVGCKWIGYWGNGRNNGGFTPTNFFGFIDGTGNESDRFRSDFGYSMVQQDVAFRRFNPNVGGGVSRINVGQWYHMEMLCEVNPVVDVANGTFKWWVNGALSFDYSDVLWRTSQYPSGFWGRRCDPVYGGQGTIPKTREDHTYIDHEYASGVV